MQVLNVLLLRSKTFLKYSDIWQLYFEKMFVFNKPI